MIAIKNISIPKTCQQPWQQMENRDNGRHCTHCSKTVIDFTKMKDGDIIKYLSATNNVCGRFGLAQLDAVNRRINEEGVISLSFWKKWLIAMGMFGATVFIKANAQTKPAASLATEQNAVGKPKVNEEVMGKMVRTDPTRARTIKGFVLDENNIPLPGVLVRVYPDDKGTETDVTGTFSLSVPATATKFVVSFIGYEPKQVPINPNSEANYQVKLQLTPVQYLGEIVIVKTPFFKRMYYKFIRRPIRKLFK